VHPSVLHQRFSHRYLAWLGSRRVSTRGSARSRRGLTSETCSRRRDTMSYDLCYHVAMAETITFRPDEDALRALSVLTQDGTPVSTAVRGALIAAARVRAQGRLRAEAATLAADEEDRAEAAQVLRDMETLRAW